jgi:hypothetical protein
MRLEPGGSIGPRTHRAQIRADQFLNSGPDGAGARRITLDLLLDHPFQHAAGEGYAGGLDRLQVDRGEQPGQRRVVPIPTTVGEDGRQLTDAASAVGARQRHGIAGGAQLAHRRRQGRQIVDARLAQRHDGRPALLAWQPHPPDECAGISVGRQGGRFAQIFVHATLLSARRRH